VMAPYNFLRRVLVLAAGSIFSLSVATGGIQNPASPQTTQPQTPTALAEAQTALEQGRIQDAIQTLSGFLDSHPKNSAARILLGQALAAWGDNDRAEAELQKALADSPNNSTALIALAELFTQSGQLEKAEPLLAKAVAASAGSPRVRIQWALVLSRLHRYKEAQSALAGVLPPKEPIERIMFQRLSAAVASGLGDAVAAAQHMEKALALKQDDAGLTIATAVAELQARNWKRAAKLAEPLFSSSHVSQAGLVLIQAQLETQTDFRPTLQLLRSLALNSPDEPAIRARLAELLVSYGEFGEAAEDLQRAVQLEPTRGDLNYNLALAQFKAGRLDDALSSAEKCQAIGDSADLQDLLGDIEEARGDYLAAIRRYQAAVGLAPSEEKYRLSLSVELLRHRNYDAAKIVLTQAQNLWPNSWRVLLALGLTQYISGGNEDAVPTLLRAVEVAPQPDSALNVVGEIELNLSSEPDTAAISSLCKYAESRPKNAKLKFYCAALTFRKDAAGGEKSHVESIRGMLQSASSLAPNDPAPHCQLGRVYRSMEQWEKSLQEWRICEQMDPDLAEAHFRLTEIYHHLGQQELADKEKKLFEAASKKMADENASREEAIRSFLLTIGSEGGGNNPR